MKKVLLYLGVILISLIITFVTFELKSWYHFGDIPTRIVLIKLILFFVVLTIIIGLVTYSILKKVNKK